MKCGMVGWKKYLMHRHFRMELNINVPMCFEIGEDYEESDSATSVKYEVSKEEQEVITSTRRHLE